LSNDDGIGLIDVERAVLDSLMAHADNLELSEDNPAVFYRVEYYFLSSRTRGAATTILAEEQKGSIAVPALLIRYELNGKEMRAKGAQLDYEIAIQWSESRSARMISAEVVHVASEFQKDARR
jgi:hypothetical protein